MALLDVDNLRKSYGELKAVDGIGFQLNAGEIFGLLGPNGAGKSTTMMMLAGLITPDSGSITLDGKTFNPEDHAFRRLLGVVPQDLAIYPDLTARENLNFFGRLYGLRGAELKSRVDEALEQTGLTGRSADFSGHFSGGMKRRLNFGIALLHRPKLLILDEPTVGVDPQSRSHLLDSVRKLSANGMAVIYASHYMEEVQTLCQRVAIVDHGKLLACDTLANLLGRMSADLRLRTGAPTPAAIGELRKLGEIWDQTANSLTFVITRKGKSDQHAMAATLARALEALARTKTPVVAVETHEPNLERLFLEMTGSRLRD